MTRVISTVQSAALLVGIGRRKYTLCESNSLLTTMIQQSTATILNNSSQKFSNIPDKGSSNDTNSMENNNNNNNRTRILSLYRSIRKLHDRSLPKALREMGNKYIQSEFRTLKDTQKMSHQQYYNFMTEWERYKTQIQYQYNQQQQDESIVKYGQPLPTDIPLSTEQQEQLHKLHQEVTTYTTSSSSSNTIDDTPKHNKLG